jgi:hypothetical protein
MAKSRHIFIYNKYRLWSVDDNYNEWNQDGLNCLPSDSVKREDLNALTQEDFIIAQKCKDDLENIQRNDKKLREKNNKKN